MSGKNHFIRSLLLPIAIVLLGLSAYEYYREGEVTWYRDPLQTLQDLSRRMQLLLPEQQQQAPFIVERGEPASHVPQAPSGVALNPKYIDPGEPRFELVGRVSRVVDGDSIEVRVQRREFPVRLFGVDSPEYNQPHGAEASRALTRKLDGRDVAVSIEDIDNYGRLVGRVYYQGHNINQEMLLEGHAWWYEQYARSEHELAAAEQAAREAGLGLWSQTAPTAPWDWRRNH